METGTTYVGINLNFGQSMGRQVLEGILKYTRSKGAWRFINCQWKSPTPDLFETAERKGFITHLSKPWTGIKGMKFDGVVNIGTHTLEPGAPSVVVDEHEVGAIAARYFLEKRLSSFAYIGYSGVGYSELRQQGFEEELSGQNADVVSFQDELSHKALESDPKIREKISKWLKGLKQPCGIFAANDFVSSCVCDTALEAGLSIPEDIALLGVDNDEVICEMAAIPLSSVTIPRRHQGYLVAKMLDQIMDKQPLEEETIYIKPSGIHTRASSEILADAPMVLSRAYYFIHRNAHQKLSVYDVAQAVNASRRYLERQFKQNLGNSPYQEIIRARLNLARSVAENSDLSVGEIADASGFQETKTFAAALSREMNQTPSDFIREVRASKTKQL